MKYKKRGKPANMVKNKEQVRHFYYRTWHKISKHIDFANGKFPVFLSCRRKTAGLILLSQLFRLKVEQEESFGCAIVILLRLFKNSAYEFIFSTTVSLTLF